MPVVPVAVFTRCAAGRCHARFTLFETFSPEAIRQRLAMVRQGIARAIARPPRLCREQTIEFSSARIAQRYARTDGHGRRPAVAFVLRRPADLPGAGTLSSANVALSPRSGRVRGMPHAHSTHSILFCLPALRSNSGMLPFLRDAGCGIVRYRRFLLPEHLSCWSGKLRFCRCACRRENAQGNDPGSKSPACRFCIYAAPR